MSACIGWTADPMCETFGQFHGCQLDEGHLGAHRCTCGAGTRVRHDTPPLNLCGTELGYTHHVQAGEICCIPCRAAHHAHESARVAS